MAAFQPRPDSHWIRAQPRESGLLISAVLAALAIHLLRLAIDLPQRDGAPMLSSTSQPPPREPPELRRRAGYR